LRGMYRVFLSGMKIGKNDRKGPGLKGEGSGESREGVAEGWLKKKEREGQKKWYWFTKVTEINSELTVTTSGVTI